MLLSDQLSAVLEGSAETSVNVLPSVFKSATFKKGGVNADIGAGKYDKASKYLAKKGVKNAASDPHNRTKEQNAKAAKMTAGGKASTATVANVLNVIRSPAERQGVIRKAYRSIGPDGVAYFSVYTGDGSGTGKKTSKGWQENRPLASYESEIKKVFPHTKVTKGHIEARKKAPEGEKPKKESLDQIFEGFIKRHGDQWCVHNEPTGLVVKAGGKRRCYPTKTEAEQVWYRLDCKYTGRHCGKIKKSMAEQLQEALEEEVTFPGILKLSLEAGHQAKLDKLRRWLPEEAVPLPAKKRHVTLVHQSVLKPFRAKLKEMERAGKLPEPPKIVLGDRVQEVKIGPKRSWFVPVKNGAEMQKYVDAVMRAVGGKPRPESRLYHVSIANLTGAVADSVGRFGRSDVAA
jgi:hypothetical protein